jgi:hypothetical protein
MAEDGTLHLVAGGREATIAAAARLADGHLVMAPTNADARDTMRVAENDRIRLFDRVYDSDSGRKRHLANNGTVVRVDGIDGPVRP